MLEENNTVIQTLFYESFREEDLRDIKDLYLQAKNGQRMLLIRNVDMTGLTPNIRKMWPEQLTRHAIVYGVFKDGKLEPEFVSTGLIPGSRFKPESCASDGE